MKTSKKILIAVAGTIVVILIITLFVFRKDVKLLMDTQAFIEYKAVPVDKFVSLDFSSNWIVTIKQGKDCKVELVADENAGSKVKLQNINGIQYFGFESANDQEYSERDIIINKTNKFKVMKENAY